MSLLNDVLRDLSQREPVPVTSQGEYDQSPDMALLQTSSIAKQKEVSFYHFVLFFLAVFSLVFAINAIVDFTHSSLQSDSQLHQSQPVAENVTKQLATHQSKNASSLKLEPDTSASALDSQSHTAATISSAVQLHIDELMQQASRAISMDRLTSPIEDNAYIYYQKILQLDPNNDEAKLGLDAIANRYLAKVYELNATGNTAQAEIYLQRARFVSANFVDAHYSELTSVNPALKESTNEAILHVNAKTSAGNLLPSQVDTMQVSSAANESIKPFTVAEAASNSVTPNIEWKDSQMAKHASQLVQQDQLDKAKDELKLFVASEPKAIHSAEALADIYIRQENYQAAQVVVDQISALPEESKAYIRAQILVANADMTQAISVLEKSISLAESNENYRALLASLYHKTANYKQSALSYLRLINRFGDKPAYWLGLALAYDGLEQHKNALLSYQRLGEFPQLQSQVKNYTNQRIAALSRE